MVAEKGLGKPWELGALYPTEVLDVPHPRALLSVAGDLSARVVREAAWGGQG